MVALIPTLSSSAQVKALPFRITLSSFITANRFHLVHSIISKKLPMKILSIKSTIKLES